VTAVVVGVCRRLHAALVGKFFNVLTKYAEQIYDGDDALLDLAHWCIILDTFGIAM
jgi:hypothetical protein